jgi:hypothetical protein
MSSQLDEVADRLATQLLAGRPGGSRLFDVAEKRGDLRGCLAGLVGVVAMNVSMFFRQLPRLADGRTTCRLYEQATGVGRDRAKTDLGLVMERLFALEAALAAPAVHAPDGPQGEALVRAASRRLVAWVAAGQTADEQLSGVEAAFARTKQITRKRNAAPEAVWDSLETYADAWGAALGRTG